MKAAVNVRRAIPNDALGISIVQAYTWKTTYTGLLPDQVIDGRILAVRDNADRIREGIVKGGLYFVAEQDSQIVGFCLAEPSRNEQYPDAGEITALYLLSAFQGLGIGKVMFLMARDALKEMGHASLVINCLKGNPALGFYRRMGGAVVGERRDEWNGATLVQDVLVVGAAR